MRRFVQKMRPCSVMRRELGVTLWLHGLHAGRGSRLWKVMKKFLCGFLFGTAMSALVAVPVLLKERHDKFQFGLNNGRTAGLREAAHSLEKKFGRFEGHASYEVLFSVKTTDVVSIETNGVRTVRVIP